MLIFVVKLYDYTAATALLGPVAAQQPKQSSSSTTATSRSSSTNDRLRSAECISHPDRLARPKTHIPGVVADASVLEPTK